MATFVRNLYSSLVLQTFLAKDWHTELFALKRIYWNIYHTFNYMKLNLLYFDFFLFLFLSPLYLFPALMHTGIYAIVYDTWIFMSHIEQTVLYAILVLQLTENRIKRNGNNKNVVFLVSLSYVYTAAYGIYCNS